MTNVDTLTEDWVKKLHVENRVDLNLRTPSPGESMKVEVGDIPSKYLDLSNASSVNASPQKDSPSNINPTNDTYLSSILSSQPKTTKNAHDASESCQLTADCVCYKCQRQRRRAGTRGRTIPIEPSLTTMNASSTSLIGQQEQLPHNAQRQQQQQQEGKPPPPPLPPHIFNSQAKELLVTEDPDLYSPEQPPAPTQTRAESFIERKRPSNISYERHLPRPTYSELDSIYHGQKRTQDKTEQLVASESGMAAQQDSRARNRNSYEISWQDETGDDILPSLRTFQTIFEEKPHESEGLSDLLESKAQELKTQKIQEKEQIEWMNQQQMEPNRPPRRNDCLTLSYRDGPQHTQLTLYHTMKLKGSKNRMAAYDKALQHCIRADSGLSLWIKNQSVQPSINIPAPNHRPNFTLKKSTYRSILHLAGRKPKTMLDDLRLKTNKLTNGTSSSNNNNAVAPLDPLLTTTTTIDSSPHSNTHNNLVPNKAATTKTPDGHVNTPSQSLPRHSMAVINDGLTTLNTEKETSMKTGKIWSSLGRKTSKTQCAPSTESVDKTYYLLASIKETSESFEKSLDDLCSIMAHVNRSVLKTYLEKENGDYMKTLAVIRDDVTSGKL